MWGLATEDTLSLLRAWKAERTPASRWSSGVKNPPNPPNQTPMLVPKDRHNQPSSTIRLSADGWGAGSTSGPVLWSRPRGISTSGALSCTHRPHSARSFSTVISTWYMNSVHRRVVSCSCRSRQTEWGPSVNGRRDDSVETLLVRS